MPEFDPSTFIPPEAPNPLKKHFRQPKVYITLPSKGMFYPEGSLNMPETGEIPVYSMTASDELTMKTPDALLNGQATVDVIKSCIPSIANPWHMPSIDLDAVLIAIRIATYGEQLDFPVELPNTDIVKDYAVDLRILLNKLVSVTFDSECTVQGMKCTVRPLTYQEFTKSSLKTFEEQRIFAVVNNDEMSEEDKLSKFASSFKKLTELTVDMMAQSVTSITTDETTVTNADHIKEFVINADKDVFKTLQTHFDTQREKFSIEPMKITPSEEEKAQGAPEQFEVPIAFDQSNFFV
mgnify:CR=1 FL=1